MRDWVWEGVQLIWVILGFIGAALGVASMPPMSRQQLVAALVSGVVCASLVPGLIPEVMAWWHNADKVVPLPPMVSNVMAFFFGIGGMFIIPGAIVFWRTARDNPLMLIEWLRGRGPAPPPVLREPEEKREEGKP